MKIKGNVWKFGADVDISAFFYMETVDITAISDVESFGAIVIVVKIDVDTVIDVEVKSSVAVGIDLNTSGVVEFGLGDIGDAIAVHVDIAKVTHGVAAV